MSALRDFAICTSYCRFIEIVLLIVVFGIVGSGTLVWSQESVDVLPAAPPLHPPRAPQEQILSPVPQQFDWINRQTPSNPLLESLLEIRRTESSLFMSLTLSEAYTDNFERSADEGADAEENFRTSLTLGTVYRRERGQGFLSLANTLSAVYDTVDENSTIGFLNLSLNTGYDVKRVSLALSDSLVIDDDTFDRSQGIETSRTTFLTNTLNPQMRFDFTPLASATLGYTNRVVVDLDANDLDSITHAATAGLQYQFERRLNSSISYTFQVVDQRGEPDGGSDLSAGGDLDEQSHNVEAELGWSLSRSVNFLVAFNALFVDRDREGATEQRQTYQMTFGVGYRLSRNWSLFVGLGPSYFVAHSDINGIEEDSDDLYGNWEASLNGKFTEQTSVDITGSQSIENTVGTVGASGLVLRTIAQLSLSHAFAIPLQGSIFATYGRNDFLENIDSVTTDNREDQFVTAGLRASYPLSRVFSLALSYEYERRFSNEDAFDFDENRVALTLSAGFDVF